jgi:hypothetical protein
VAEHLGKRHGIAESKDGAPVDNPWQSCGAPSSVRLGDQQEVSRICHELSD